MFEKFRYYHRTFGKRSITSTSPEETDFLKGPDFSRQANDLSLHYWLNPHKSGRIRIVCYDVDQANQTERILNQKGFMPVRKK